MKKPEIPHNETQRIDSLKNLGILDTPIEEAFERITRLAKVIFQVPIVAFSLVDSERQWFKSIQGLNVCETSREVSFCGHTINQDGVFIVNDALLDDRFATNPLVTGAPNIRFYAGYPVLSPDKQKIGTICIIDTQPRSLSEENLLQLKDIAGLIENEVVSHKISFERYKLIEELSRAKKLANVDSLTRLLNRTGIEDLLQMKITSAKESKTNFGIALIDVDNFKSINDTHGHNAGDEVLRQISKRLMTGYRDTDSIGRWGGEEFIVILGFKNEKDLAEVANRAREIISKEPFIYNDKPLAVTITSGIARFYHENPIDILTLIANADRALYSGKHKGKNIVVENDDIYQFKAIY